MSTHTKATEDLAYIRELMADTRRAAGVSGGYFILWGAVVGLGLLLTWLQVIGLLPYRPLLTWLPCLGLGVLGNVILLRRDLRKPTHSRAGRLIATVWIALGITQLILFAAHMGFDTLPGAYLPAIFSCVLGSGIFMTGVFAGLTWLRNLAFAWWLGAILMFAVPGDHVALIMAALLLLAYAVPGLILVKQEKAASAGEV